MKKRIVIGVAVLLAVAAAGGAAFFGLAWLRYDDHNLPGAYFDSGGVRIHYAEKGSGTPVVLVHGLGVNLGMNWVRSGIFDGLAKDHRVVALDLRGHGLSGKPHDPALYGVTIVEDIVRLMDHLGIDRAHVVGYSMGGFIALKMAETRPGRLLSVAPCGSGWSSDPGKDLAFLKMLADRLDHGGGFESLLERLQPVGRPVGRGKILMVSAMMTMANDRRAVSAMLRSTDALLVGADTLKNNKTPALCIAGERDPLKPLADQMCAATANMRQVVVPGADHFSTLSKPDFLRELAAFLTEIDEKEHPQPKTGEPK